MLSSNHEENALCGIYSYRQIFISKMNKNASKMRNIVRLGITAHI